jgi:hypothetical protein
MAVTGYSRGWIYEASLGIQPLEPDIMSGRLTIIRSGETQPPHIKNAKTDNDRPRLIITKLFGS